MQIVQGYRERRKVELVDKRASEFGPNFAKSKAHRVQIKELPDEL